MGIGISATSIEEVVAGLGKARDDRAAVVAVCTVHSVVTARSNSALAEALREADVATPDGVPLGWAMRWIHGIPQRRVYGPDIMRAGLGALGHRHFLYGSTQETLTKLVGRIDELWPSADVVGALSPPFRELTEGELDEHVASIRDSGATVVWVGLGMPKQELWMHRARSKLPGVTLVGVGAAFDFLSGNVRQAPGWMQRIGLEWLYRLAQEPRRLWRRYLTTIPPFLLLVGAQLLRSLPRRILGSKE